MFNSSLSSATAVMPWLQRDDVGARDVVLTTEWGGDRVDAV